VIIVNAEKIQLTGNKLNDKMYYRHSGHPGGLTERNAYDMVTKDPEKMIEIAIRGMLPKGSLGRKMFKKLHVYRGAEHNHAAQKPEEYVLKGKYREVKQLAQVHYYGTCRRKTTTAHLRLLQTTT